jgi:hypothetical protein
MAIKDIFENELYTELFTARCNDSGESVSGKLLIFLKFIISVENAKLFKEDLLKRNVKDSTALNLQSLRLGINSVISLSNTINQTGGSRHIDKLNLADNAVTDYGMHAVKNILGSTSAPTTKDQKKATVV